ncbi:hypothetical protein [Listeria seeligeri]|uniref:hypothetical protein n=2 Tax=Listeria seeligeri TaxID=1640 RepID=UPI001627C547|nr:hypothetical protein [Listeria seeligeri]MBC1533285.1 hypothetical protein [Listeria seeligeri]MBC1740415.1 hypothetical protein [Listeria seeligeri]MBC1746011.1 hypothetical protein [Listeria seeligeri]MBC1748867.1 hypothetical protein [Listeria seeligeri]MBC1821588.1 hypothetical protein [Listeria seeligeri]
MKIDLEQVYTLEFTMRLRHSPMAIRSFLKLFFLITMFLTWIQGTFMEMLPGNINTTKIDWIVISVAAVIYLILYPKKIAVKFQNLQYIFAILCVQLLTFMGIRFFYFNIFVSINREIEITAQTIKMAYDSLFILWLFVFLFFCFRFRKKLRSGEYREDSKLQKRRSNLGLKLPKGVYIAMAIYFAVIMFSQLIGGIVETAVLCSIMFTGLVLAFSGVSLFPEHLFTAYCKFKFKEFHIEE